MPSMAKLHVLDAVKDLSHYWSCHSRQLGLSQFPTPLPPAQVCTTGCNPKQFDVRNGLGIVQPRSGQWASSWQATTWKRCEAKPSQWESSFVKKMKPHEITISCLDVVEHLSRQCLMRWQSALLWSCSASQTYPEDPGPWPCNCFRGAKQDRSAMSAATRLYPWCIQDVPVTAFYAVRLVWRPVTVRFK